MYKNLYVSADSNVKMIDLDLRNRVLQKVTRNGTDVYIDYRRTHWDKKLSQYRAQSSGYTPQLCSMLKYLRYVQNSYAPPSF